MSNSLQPHGLQPASLLYPWDFPGKNTGVGCHFLLQCMKVKVKTLSHIRLWATPWTAAYQAPPSLRFSRQKYWSGVPLPSPTMWVAGVYFKRRGNACIMCSCFPIIMKVIHLLCKLHDIHHSLCAPLQSLECSVRRQMPMNNLECFAHFSLLMCVCMCLTEAFNRAYAKQGVLLPEWFLYQKEKMFQGWASLQLGSSEDIKHYLYSSQWTFCFYFTVRLSLTLWKLAGKKKNLARSLGIIWVQVLVLQKTFWAFRSSLKCFVGCGLVLDRC